MEADREGSGVTDLVDNHAVEVLQEVLGFVCRALRKDARWIEFLFL